MVTFTEVTTAYESGDPDAVRNVTLEDLKDLKKAVDTATDFALKWDVFPLVIGLIIACALVLYGMTTAAIEVATAVGLGVTASGVPVAQNGFNIFKKVRGLQKARIDFENLTTRIENQIQNCWQRGLSDVEKMQYMRIVNDAIWEMWDLQGKLAKNPVETMDDITKIFDAQIKDACPK